MIDCLCSFRFFVAVLTAACLGVFCCVGILLLVVRGALSFCFEKQSRLTVAMLSILAFVALVEADKCRLIRGRGTVSVQDRTIASSPNSSTGATNGIARIESIAVQPAGVDVSLHRPQVSSTQSETVTLAISTNYAIGTNGGLPDSLLGSWRAVRDCTFYAGDEDVHVRLSHDECGPEVLKQCFFSFAGAGDTDGDGLLDWEEVLNEGSDPNDAYSIINAITLGHGESFLYPRAYRDGIAHRFGGHLPTEVCLDGYTVFEHALYADRWDRPMPSPLVIGKGDAILEFEVTVPADNEYATLVIGSRRVPLEPGWTRRRIAVAVDGGEWLDFYVEGGPSWIPGYHSPSVTIVDSDAYVLRQEVGGEDLDSPRVQLLVLPYPRAFCLHELRTGSFRCAYGTSDGYGTPVSVSCLLLDGRSDVVFSNASVLGVDVLPSFPFNERRRVRVTYSHPGHVVGPSSVEVEVHYCPKPGGDYWPYNVWQGDVLYDWQRPSGLWPIAEIACGCCDEGAPGCRCANLVSPFDRDGDGLVDDLDPEPLVAQPSTHNANADWYATVCAGVFEKAPVPELLDTRTFELPDGGRIRFREGVNERAYYFVDVIVENGPAKVDFTADRDSSLGSPVVVALPGEICHVPLLIGVEYTVTSTEQVSVSFPGSGFAEVSEQGERSFIIKWPLDFVFEEDAPGEVTVNVVPFDPGGVFLWEDGGTEIGENEQSIRLLSSCGCWRGVGNHLACSCSQDCGCYESCRVRGTYISQASFEVEGSVCCCRHFDTTSDVAEPPPLPDPLSGGLSITFSKAAVLFEDSYANPPGVVVSRRSTKTRLTISASGGMYGGSFLISTSGLEKLILDGGGEMPLLVSGMTLAPGQTYYATYVCSGVAPSDDEEDVVVSGEFSEVTTGRTESAASRLTVVQLEFRPLTGLGFAHRHTIGVRESCIVNWLPRTANVSLYDSGNGLIPARTAYWYYHAPLVSEDAGLEARILDVTHQFRLKIVEPRQVVVQGSPSKNLFGLGMHQAGGVGLSLDLHILPKEVSFAGIAVQEVPTDYRNPKGYFSNDFFRPLWSHTRERRAGEWHNIAGENFFMPDGANFGDECPRMTPGGVLTDDVQFGWAKGTMDWRIPVGWNEANSNNDDDFVVKSFQTYWQQFRINEQGTMTVAKLGWAVTRGTNDISRVWRSR